MAGTVFIYTLVNGFGEREDRCGLGSGVEISSEDPPKATRALETRLNNNAIILSI